MVVLQDEIEQLRVVLARGPHAHDRRQRLRASLLELERLLAEPTDAPDDAWLEARSECAERRRLQLGSRVTVLAAAVLHRRDVGSVEAEARRLVVDLERHQQRLHDLVYDGDTLELGGSE